MQRCFPLDRLRGCVYVFHCDNQDRRVCVRLPRSFIFLLGPAGSKRRSSTGRKRLAPEDEITVRPTRDFLPTQEVEAQLRGKGLFLCHHPPPPPVPALPASSSMIRVLSQDRRNASLAPAPLSDQAGSAAHFVYITEVLSPAIVA